MKYFWIYILLVNLISFYLFGIDKKRSRQGQWRMSESTLLFIAFLGGSVGSLLGMKFFRHKTRRWKFKILVPIFLILHAFIYFYYIYVTMG